MNIIKSIDVKCICVFRNLTRCVYSQIEILKSTHLKGNRIMNLHISSDSINGSQLFALSNKDWFAILVDPWSFSKVKKPIELKATILHRVRFGRSHMVDNHVSWLGCVNRHCRHHSINHHVRWNLQDHTQTYLHAYIHVKKKMGEPHQVYYTLRIPWKPCQFSLSIPDDKAVNIPMHTTNVRNNFRNDIAKWGL